MRFIGFEIENFKGVTKTSLNFSKIPNADVFTLVGLNESGKTTLLEAINSFSPNNDGIESLYKDVFKRVLPQDLIPKTKKGIFSGEISVRALVAIDADDRKQLKDFCKTKLNAEIDLSGIPNAFQIERVHTFVNSNHTSTDVYWNDVDVILKKKGKNSKFKTHKDTSKEWQQVSDFLAERLPVVSYFPTFLFGFPEKIYLSNPPDDFKDASVNAYYVQIIQDILDSIGNNLSIKTHILDKVERTVKPDGLWNWYGFLRTDEKQQIDHIMLLIENKISAEVIDRWDSVFGVKLKNKSIDIEWAVEDATNGSRSVYLTFRIRDGQGQYNLAERSLGFRWFFCFLLFTQFRAFRKDSSAMFLFDEPASNLHSRAQEQLLKSFSTITKGKNAIVYTTHSPYMIEPKWLEGAFIVSNEAIDFEKDPGEEEKARCGYQYSCKKVSRICRQKSVESHLLPTHT